MYILGCQFKREFKLFLAKAFPMKRALNTILGQIRIVRDNITYIKITRTKFSEEDLEQHRKLIQDSFGADKHWFLINFNHIQIDSHEEVKSHIASFYDPDLIHAVALIVNDSVNKLLGYLIQNSVVANFPFKVFLYEKDAIKWLQRIQNSDSALNRYLI